MIFFKLKQNVFVNDGPHGPIFVSAMMMRDKPEGSDMSRVLLIDSPTISAEQAVSTINQMLRDADRDTERADNES